MTPPQIHLVQRTFALLIPIADTAVMLFYGRMFELDPSLRPLFPTDMTRQRQKLLDTLAMAVRGLENPDEFVAALRALGQRHATYGVQPAHYQTMNEALIWMLTQGLGKNFSDEMKEAWTAMYQMLVDAMHPDSATLQ